MESLSAFKKLAVASLLFTPIVLVLVLNAQVKRVDHRLISCKGTDFGRINLAETCKSVKQMETLINQDTDHFKLVTDIPTDTNLRKLTQPIGRLDLKVRGTDGKYRAKYCTAWIISKDHLMTNYHCNPGRDPGTVVEAALLRMGYISETRTGDPYFVRAEPVESNKELDYSILLVAREPWKDYGMVKFQGMRDPKPGEDLVIVQHPAGLPKRVTNLNCYAADNSPVEGNTIRHKCDTCGGSSGAPVFSADDFSLIGLHHAGFLHNEPDHPHFNYAKRMEPIISASRYLPFIVPNLIQDRTPLWGLVMSRGGRFPIALPNEEGKVPPIPQTYFPSEEFPDDFIKQMKEEENFRITTLTYVEPQWIVVMAELKDAVDEVYKRLENFPTDWVDRQRLNGKFIEHVAYGNGEWVVVMHSPKEGQQVYLHEKIFPGKEMTQKMAREGYDLTEITHAEDQWIVVLTKTEENRKQDLNASQDWPSKWIKEIRKQDFHITDAVYAKDALFFENRNRASRWFLVATKTPEIESQIDRVRNYFPDGPIWDIGTHYNNFFIDQIFFGRIKNPEGIVN